jgi:hypothetical protein
MAVKSSRNWRFSYLYNIYVLRSLELSQKRNVLLQTPKPKWPKNSLKTSQKQCKNSPKMLKKKPEEHHRSLFKKRVYLRKGVYLRIRVYLGKEFILG